MQGRLESLVLGLEVLPHQQLVRWKAIKFTGVHMCQIQVIYEKTRAYHS